ncbi:MAG: preprotein translocase subunit SecE [Lachnospiraceae bacterium]|nr:preprotein translocase subunit SecE [Lachnospiraceae bacterium]
MSEKNEKTQPALKRSWFKELKSEFGKISWPNKTQLFKETSVVFVAAVLIGAIIVVVDWVLNLGLQFIW